MKKLFQGKTEPEPEIDIVAAKQLLDNVLDACNYEHNTIPIEVLSSYSSYRKERYSIQNALLIIMLVLFLLLPMLFFSPEVNLAPCEGAENSRLKLQVSSVIPVQSVSATMNGKNVPVYQAGTGEYIIQPAENGVLKTSVTLLNRQTGTADYEVGFVDNAAPKLIRSEVIDEMLVLSFKDEESGINPDSLQVINDDDEPAQQVSWSTDHSQIRMPYPTEITHIYLADHSGNTLHLLLTPQ